MAVDLLSKAARGAGGLADEKDAAAGPSDKGAVSSPTETVVQAFAALQRFVKGPEEEARPAVDKGPPRNSEPAKTLAELLDGDPSMVPSLGLTAVQLDQATEEHGLGQPKNRLVAVVIEERLDQIDNMKRLYVTEGAGGKGLSAVGIDPAAGKAHRDVATARFNRAAFDPSLN